MEMNDVLRATNVLPPGKKLGTYWIGGWMFERQQSIMASSIARVFIQKSINKKKQV
jgi:hypothetical protein